MATTQTAMKAFGKSNLLLWPSLADTAFVRALPNLNLPPHTIGHLQPTKLDRSPSFGKGIYPQLPHNDRCPEVKKETRALPTIGSELCWSSAPGPTLDGATPSTIQRTLHE